MNIKTPQRILKKKRNDDEKNRIFKIIHVNDYHQRVCIECNLYAS